MQANAVLEFWFSEAGFDKWYNGADAFDAEIRTRFAELTTKIAAEIKQGKTYGWPSEPLPMPGMMGLGPANMGAGLQKVLQCVLRS
ncbi:MAG: DUF924 family protein [Robiginitomaculum sp.]